MPPLLFLRLSFLLFAGYDFVPDWLAAMSRMLSVGGGAPAGQPSADIAFAAHWLTRYAQWLVASDDPCLPSWATVESVERSIRAIAAANDLPIDNAVVPVSHGALPTEVVVNNTKLVRACLYFSSPVLVPPGEFRHDVAFFGGEVLCDADGSCRVRTHGYTFVDPATGSVIPPVRSPFFSCLTGLNDT